MSYDGGLDGVRRQLVKTTDAAGRAAVTFTLGSHAGAGSQRVQATAPAILGKAVFVATATPGLPAHLYVDSGDQQVGATGQPLPDPFIVVVTNEGFNRLESVPVSFRIVKGLDIFTNGLPEIIAASAVKGRATAVLRLDLEEGVANNVVQAHLADFPEVRFATFVASGLAAGVPTSSGEEAILP